MKVNAVFIKNIEYEVVFKDNRGILKEQKVRHGESAQPPEDIDWDPFVFKGWDTEFEEVTEDLVIEANWEIDMNKGEILSLEEDYDGQEEIVMTEEVLMTWLEYGIESWDDTQ